MEDLHNQVPITVWAGRSVDSSLYGGRDIDVVPYFQRRLRRLQVFLLYRRLLRAPGRIFVQTAGRNDLFLINLASGGQIPPNKVFFYFHWLRLNDKKKEFIRKMAVRVPELTIITPVESVASNFLEMGFARVKQVPYPITSAPQEAKPSDFRQVLFAGAARRDKGFDKVVDLVEYMAVESMQLPITIQASADHYDRYDDKTKIDADRLEKVNYPWMDIKPLTLEEDEYRKLFQGSICLQPYSRDEFADRVSGVTLDAFSQGCPIVTTEGTWMAKLAHRFEAGIAVDELSPEFLFQAVDVIRGDYSSYSDKAVEAGRVLGNEHSAGHLVKLLMEGL